MKHILIALTCLIMSTTSQIHCSNQSKNNHELSLKKIAIAATLFCMFNAVSGNQVCLNSTVITAPICPIQKTHSECDSFHGSCGHSYQHDSKHLKNWHPVTGKKFKRARHIQNKFQEHQKELKQKESACVQQRTQDCQKIALDAQKVVAVRDSRWQELFDLLEERRNDGRQCWDGYFSIFTPGYWSKPYWSGCRHVDSFFEKWISSVSDKNQRLKMLEWELYHEQAIFNDFKKNIREQEASCIQNGTQDCQNITLNEQETAMKTDPLFQEWLHLQAEEEHDLKICSKSLRKCHNNVEDLDEINRVKQMDEWWLKYQKNHPEAHGHKNFKDWIRSPEFAKLHSSSAASKFNFFKWIISTLVYLQLR